MADHDGARDPITGRILPGNTLNRRGRPPKARTVDEVMLAAANELVTVTIDGQRKRRTKLEVTAAQLVNQSAGGNLSAGKTTLDQVRRAEERKAQAGRTSEELSASDRDIADRYIAKMRRLFELERGDDLTST